MERPVTPGFLGHSQLFLDNEHVLDDYGQTLFCGRSMSSNSPAINGTGLVSCRDSLWLVSRVASGQRAPACVQISELWVRDKHQ